MDSTLVPSLSTGGEDNIGYPGGAGRDGPWWWRTGGRVRSSNLPGPEIKPMSPVLAGGFLSAMPPGKSDTYIVTIPVLSQMGLPVSSI